MPIRYMRPGALHATPSGAWLIDDQLPISAFADGRDRSVEFIGSWFEECVPHGWVPRRRVCTALAASDADCWIASPDAGVVRLSREGKREGKSVFPMPAPVHALACTQRACWVLLDLADRQDGQRPPALWRIDRAGARSFDTDFVLLTLAAAGGQIFGLGQRGSDPGDDDSSHLAVLRIAEDAQVEVLAEFRSSCRGPHVLHTGRERPWLEGDSLGLAGSQGEHWIQPVESSRGGWRLGGRLPLPRLAQLTVDDQDVAWSRTRAASDVRDFDHRFAAVRLPLASMAESRIRLPGNVGPLTGAGGRAWCVSRHRLPQLPGAPPDSLLRLTPGPGGDINLAEVVDWPEVTGLIPDIRPPEGVDPGAWAESQRASLEAELRHGWRDQATSETYPYISRTAIESVTLAGRYPATERVIRFRMQKRPGVPFGRRVRCFDDLGAPRPGDYDALQLMEDVETGAMPPHGRDIPDTDGVVWV